MFEKYDDIVDVATVCKMLKIGKTSCYELIKTNKIKSFKIKNKILIAKIGVINFVEKERKIS
ncbi:MAG: helix-turn-helix domain-containing protein [Epulopiscium sp.]|jgi:hypothetical protein|nr:helix-turn-helix domain-containing protein [Candidatus Epulonipiscium sp.]